MSLSRTLRLSLTSLHPLAHLRRDINTIIGLVRTHALLCQATRKHRYGNIVATISDYAAIRDLVGDLMSEGVGVSVKKSIREVVEAVDKKTGTRQSDIVEHLVRFAQNLLGCVGLWRNAQNLPWRR